MGAGKSFDLNLTVLELKLIPMARIWTYKSDLLFQEENQSVGILSFQMDRNVTAGLELGIGKSYETSRIYLFYRYEQSVVPSEARAVNDRAGLRYFINIKTLDEQKKSHLILTLFSEGERVHLQKKLTDDGQTFDIANFKLYTGGGIGFSW